MADDRPSNPTEDVRRLYEEAEARTANAFEEVVSRGAFGELLARLTENVVGLTKISTDVFDLMLRNLRLAGRQDVNRLARQLARNEDKLELILQHVERLDDELQRGRAHQTSTNGSPGDGDREGSRTAAREEG